MLPAKLLTVIVVLAYIGSGHALDNGLALTPPMGFMSWERFRCDTDCSLDPTECISENLYMSIADSMASNGYLEAGYEFVIIDDCWMATTRDENGKLQPDPTRFPSGIKALSDYVHSLGLKLGIYEDYGNFTCGGYPGILGHLQEDAQTFADWGIDYLKLDGCYSDIYDMEKGYPQMGQYLNDTGRPIVYSCSWPAYWTTENLDPNYTAIATTCNLWRNWDDIDDSWDSVLSIIDYFGDHQDELIAHAGPGHWNDPDMIIVGDFGLSYDESEVQLAIWSILAAPLLVSADLRNIKDEFKDLLLNKEVIAVDQDPLGIQGRRLSQNNGIEIWSRPLTPTSSDSTYYSYAVAFLNRGSEKTHVNTILQDIGLTYESGYNIVDLYNGDSYGTLGPQDELSVLVDPSGVIFVKATLVD